jgi:DNA-binding beta-propeller fold protein YncE
LEVIDLVSQVRVHSIPGIPEPQGVAHASGLNKIFVGSRGGKLYIYDGTTYGLISAIDYNADVDAQRYDAASKRVYVGYGDEDKAAIGMVDATTNHRLDQEYKTGGHPESFQLETSGPNIYGNLPDLKQIAVIDRATAKITRWPIALEENFPMALDEADHRLFVGTRTPPRLAVFDTNTGKMVVTLESVADMDDLYYDASRKRVYVPGGQGSISVFQQKDAPTTMSFLPKFPRRLAHAPRAIPRSWERRGSTAFTSLFRLPAVTEQKSGFIQCRIEDLRGMEA